MENKLPNIELEILKHRTQCSELFLLKRDFVSEITELKTDIYKELGTMLAFVKTRASRGLVVLFISIFGLLIGASGTIIYANFGLYDKVNDRVIITREELKSENSKQDIEIELNKYINQQILDALKDIKLELQAIRQERINDLKNNKISIKGGSNDRNGG